MPTPLRLGILGAGNIARQFATALQTSSLVSVTAVGSRSLEKAKAFAEPLNFAAAHGSYEALLADDGIDAVYVCLPNSMHAEWAIKAAEAGKHVLCEKPLALDGTESRRMFAAADQAGVILREAYPYLAQQQSKIMRGWLREKSIGTPSVPASAFCLTIQPIFV